ncbi:Mycophenolic acid synthesis protein B [Fusarium oxysporum f. sp. albedinis]|nr:Mycophenolic acid synthesis protein B [Fusarium oxysporum f. sp. albedinis]
MFASEYALQPFQPNISRIIRHWDIKPRQVLEIMAVSRVLLVNPMLSHNGAWIVSPRYRMADRYIDYTQVD